jgi:hypothetical protein
MLLNCLNMAELKNLIKEELKPRLKVVVKEEMRKGKSFDEAYDIAFREVFDDLYPKKQEAVTKFNNYHEAINFLYETPIKTDQFGVKSVDQADILNDMALCIPFNPLMDLGALFTHADNIRFVYTEAGVTLPPWFVQKYSGIIDLQV